MQHISFTDIWNQSNELKFSVINEITTYKKLRISSGQIRNLKIGNYFLF